MRTFQARPQLDPTVASLLDAYGKLFGHALRILHARRRSGVPVAKPTFMTEFGLTARQFNALRVTLDGIERSYRRRLPLLIAEDRLRLASLQRRRSRSTSAFVAHQLARRIARIQDRIRKRGRDLSENAVRIAFGSRKLFRAQHALHANGYPDHASWRSAWQQARSSQFFVLGSKDENAGCQGCVMTHLGEGRFSVRVRLPNTGPSKYVVFEVDFAYGWKHLAWALLAGQAISYRFLRDAKGWRIFASTAALSIESISELQRGALGVDLNADHVAIALTKRDGNLISSQRIPLVISGKSRERASALAGDVVKEIIAAALRVRIPIVLEKLDFAKKKTCLRESGARYARMLSSFAYRRFAQMLRARAHDAGIAVILTNPAYSSVIGHHKFARRYGISGHQAAALVLARRAQRFSERPNRRDQLTLRSPARKNARYVWSSWVGIAREEARDGLYGRSRKRDPSAAAAADVTISPVAGGIPAREFVANTVRAAS